MRDQKNQFIFDPMLEQGLLIRTERGSLQTYDFQGDCIEMDAMYIFLQENGET